MSNVDIQIYISQIKTFFNENPEQLVKLIGNINPDIFFDEVEKVSTINYEKGEDVQLTNKQMVSILFKINKGRTKDIVAVEETKFGKLYLN
jgi:hypothetical protein